MGMQSFNSVEDDEEGNYIRAVFESELGHGGYGDSGCIGPQNGHCFMRMRRWGSRTTTKLNIIINTCPFK